jgi:hypothetical protein
VVGRVTAKRIRFQPGIGQHTIIECMDRPKPVLISVNVQHRPRSLQKTTQKPVVSEP